VEIHEKRISHEAASLVKRDPHSVFDDFYKEGASHCVVALRPTSAAANGKRTIGKSVEMVIATKFLQFQVAQAALRQNTIHIKRIYEQLAGVPILRGAAGYVFESLVHQMLAQRGSLLQTTSSDGNEVREILIQGKHRFCYLLELKQTLRMSATGKGSRSWNPDYTGLYLWPAYTNLESIDSLVIVEDPQNKKKVPILFQITIADRHPVHTKGLDSVWDTLPQGVKKEGVLLVFVVPEGSTGFAAGASGFTPQSYVGEATGVERWSKRATQMVLRVATSEV
jgi:hypothetical protein